jgi:hypothetical protein
LFYNADVQAAVLVGESIQTDQKDSDLSSKLDPLLSDVGIMKMLIWLMAPVAMESSKHAQLIVSDHTVENQRVC